jgi:hypothetical protein
MIRLARMKGKTLENVSRVTKKENIKTYVLKYTKRAIQHLIKSQEA